MENGKIGAFWLISGEPVIGLGKLLKQNAPTDPIFLLQILMNEGKIVKLVIKEKDGNILHNLQIIFDKNMTESNLRFTIKQIFGKLEINTANLSVLSIWKLQENQILQIPKLTNVAMDIITHEDINIKQKITIWKIIKNWSDEKVITHYEFDPKFQQYTDKLNPYNILHEIQKGKPENMVMEVTIWYQDDLEGPQTIIRTLPPIRSIISK